MLHWAREGEPARVGLNVSLGWAHLGASRGLDYWRPWVSLTWVWVNLPERTAARWKIRFRPYMRPWFVRSHDRCNLIEDWAVSHDCYVFAREVVEDHSLPAKLALYGRVNWTTVDG
jgi:hypothetical protein